MELGDDLFGFVSAFVDEILRLVFEFLTVLFAGLSDAFRLGGDA